MFFRLEERRAERHDVWERDGGICGVCREPVTLADMQVDHKLAVCLGGDRVAFSNQQPSHGPCNRRKGLREMWARGVVAQWRKNGGPPTTEALQRLATKLMIPPELLVAQFGVERGAPKLSETT